jgi:RNA polymerase sigma-70 factor (ECF subfamily)
MTDPKKDESALLERLIGGDNSVLGDLFALHRNRLWRMVNFRLDRRLGTRLDADDILQEAYVDASQRIEHYTADPTKSFYIWLRLIVTQTMIDAHRRHLGTQKRDIRREQKKQVAYPEATSISLARRLIGSVATPSQAAVKAEALEQLEQALEKMDQTDQEVLSLRHFEELTNTEVSEVLGIQQKAASIRYVRAIARLKDVLAKVPGFFDGIQNTS